MVSLKVDWTKSICLGNHFNLKKNPNLFIATSWKPHSDLLKSNLPEGNSKRDPFPHTENPLEETPLKGTSVTSWKPHGDLLKSNLPEGVPMVKPTHREPP